MPALGMEEDQSRPGQLLDAEQVQLLAQLAMVAFLGLFELGQMLVQFFLREKCRPVDALQLRVLLIALPVRSGDGKQLERLDLLGGRHVRPAAEVDEMRPQRVFGKDLAGALRDQLALSWADRRTVSALSCFGVYLRSYGRSRAWISHIRASNLFEILGRERRVALEIVIESRLDGRPDAELGLRKQFQHRRRQQMRGRVAIDFAAPPDFGGQNLQLGIALPAAGSDPTDLR